MKKRWALLITAGFVITGCQAQPVAQTQTNGMPDVQTNGLADAQITGSDEISVGSRGDIVDRNGVILATTEDNQRVYPNDSLACEVIGYTNAKDDAGNSGIEQFYNTQLKAVPGVSAANGHTVVSTIDAEVQRVVEKYIDEWQQEAGADHVGVVVMDPTNGEVLAMASDSRFDLNERQATDESESDEENRDFCISSVYEPGSLSQVFTVAAALEEGVLNGSESFLCEGTREIGGVTIRCMKRSGHEMLTLEEAIMHGCNVSMMQIAELEGQDRFLKYQQAFGFGARTGIDLPGEADTGSLVYTADTMDELSLATNSFGQNYSCTMIQMAAAYGSLINGGSYYQPHVVKQVLDEQGQAVESTELIPVRLTVSKSTSDFIKETLYQTVQDGTGKNAAVEGYDIAGKTGVAEKTPRGIQNYVVSFCGFAPVDEPQLLVYVVIDTPHVDDQPHSSYASDISRKIMSDVLPRLDTQQKVYGLKN